MKIHLFLIDNDEDELEFLNEAMLATGYDYRCSYAPCAERALQALPQLNVDFIFIDINMPMIDGYQCLAMIKKENLQKNAHLVMYSTGLDSISEAKALALGAHSCVRKTITIPELSLVISDLIINFFKAK